MSLARRLPPLMLGGLAALFATHCSTPVAPGELVMVLQTDLSLPKDVDSVQLSVLVRGDPSERFTFDGQSFAPTGTLRGSLGGSGQPDKWAPSVAALNTMMASASQDLGMGLLPFPEGKFDDSGLAFCFDPSTPMCAAPRAPPWYFVTNGVTREWCPPPPAVTVGTGWPISRPTDAP